MHPVGVRVYTVPSHINGSTHCVRDLLISHTPSFMFSLNRVHIIGYQTQPVSLRQTPGGPGQGSTREERVTIGGARLFGLPERFLDVGG